MLRHLVWASLFQGVAHRLAPQVAEGAAHPRLHPLREVLTEAAVEGPPIGGRRQELEPEFPKAHAGPDLGSGDGSGARVARVHQHHEPVGLMLAAEALDVVDEVKGRVVGRRKLSICRQEVKVAVLGHLFAVPDKGEQKSRFITCCPLERPPDGLLGLHHRRVDHKPRRVKRRLASTPLGIGQHLVQPRSYVRQKRQHRKALALRANDKKVSPAHAWSIGVTYSIGQDLRRSPRRRHSARRAITGAYQQEFAEHQTTSRSFPDTDNLYRSIIFCRCYELRFGPMGRLRQDRGSCAFGCCT